MIAARGSPVRPSGADERRFPGLWSVVLAAGGARRFGRNKLLLRIGGETLLRRAASRAMSVSGARCVVVLGADAPLLAAALAGLPCRVVVAHGWREGLAASLRTGIRALPASASAALVTLADLYAVEGDDLERLARAWARAPRQAAAALVAGRPGAPAILPRRYFGRVRALRGDQGARRLLRSDAEPVTTVELPAAAQDLDERCDLARVRRHRQGGRR